MRSRALLLLLALAAADPAGAKTSAILAAPPGREFASGQVSVERDHETQTLSIRFEWPTGAPPGAFSTWIETAAASGAFFEAGAMAAGGASGGWTTWRLSWAPPGGADLDDLSGRRIEVRDGPGTATFLEGAVPHADPTRKPEGGAAAGRSDLVRPEAAPLPAARGRVLVTEFAGAGRLMVEAGKLSAGTFPDPGLLTVWIEDSPIGTLAPLYAGNPWRGSFRLLWRIDVAADAGAVAGGRIEVRDSTGALRLEGLLPAVSTSPAPRPVRAASMLAPPPGSLTPGASGAARLRFDPSLGRSEFRLDGRRLEGVADATLWIETWAGSGAFEAAASLDFRGTAVRFLRRTERGDPLPLGAASAADLAGRAVEVRDAAGRICLAGTLPLLGGPTRREELPCFPRVVVMLRDIR